MNKGFISDVGRLNELEKCIPKQIRVLTIVIPPLQLVKIGVKMLGAQLMVSPNDRALEQAPDILDVVGVDFASNVLLDAVIDRLMPRVVIRNTLIWRPVIGVDHFRFSGGSGTNEPVKGFTASPVHHLEPDVTISLHSAGNDGFVLPIAVPLATHLATNERLVNLDFATQRPRVKLGSLRL